MMIRRRLLWRATTPLCGSRAAARTAAGLLLLCLLATPTLAQEGDPPEEPGTEDPVAMPGDADDPADAEAADTTQRGPSALIPAGPPLGFDASAGGRMVSDSLPALVPETDLVGLLSRAPASFTYLFGRSGWPDGWSPFGLSPNERPLSFQDVPFTHLFTGRPAYNLVPFTLLERPRLEPQRHGRPAAVATRLRPFVSPVPITEGTYWRGGDGLQSIDVVHAQHRRRTLFGQPGFLNVMGSYSGRATSVEYPGSDLRRGRRVQGRLRYEQSAWSVELLNIHNRRTVGAHGGVIPPGGVWEGIFRSDLADVESPEAERRMVRNDLMATVRFWLAGPEPSSLTGYWTAETFRYRNRTDTLLAVSDRLGLRILQPLASSRSHRLAVRVETWTERTTPGGHFEASAERRSYLYVFARDSLGTGRLRAELEAGWAAHSDGGGPAASVLADLSLGAVGVALEASTSTPALPIAYRTGFGALRGIGNAGRGRLSFVNLSAGIRGGAFSLTVGGFGHQEARPVDLFVAGDSAAVRQADSPIRRAGAYADFGWRRDASRGFYAVVRPMLSASVGGDASDLHRRQAEVLPTWFGRARFGARYVIFQGDLDFDVYVETVAWSEFAGRRLDPATGLLLIPEPGARPVAASSMINAAAEMRVRDATLFLVYDNALAGTTLLPGNLLVPVYPLPAQRFRFGVYWPIFG